MKKLLLISLLSLILFSTCKTDFEINSEWKDIMVVYGLLNQNDSIHYIKINKAFLGEDNAMTMAQNPDSSSYGNNLEVWVEEWINNSQNFIWYLDTTTIYNKESGTFYSPKQIVYKFNSTSHPLNEDAEYRLYIKNKTTGKLVSSVTPLVHSFSIEKPTAMQTAVFHATNPYAVIWYSGVNGKRYQVVIRFNYWEQNIITGDSVKKYVDWNIGSYKSESIEGGEKLSTTYYGNTFFQYLGNVIGYTPDVVRHVVSPNNVNFIFSVAADDFSTYMEVNAPSTGVLQEKPEYTNINNGYGIFSSRFMIDRPLPMHPTSLDSLIHGVYTKDLNFQ
jgi:hypothetical protein